MTSVKLPTRHTDAVGPQRVESRRYALAFVEIDGVIGVTHDRGWLLLSEW
jgi:hypothetical protein